MTGGDSAVGSSEGEVSELPGGKGAYTKGVSLKMSLWKTTKLRRLPGSPSGRRRKRPDSEILRRLNVVAVSGRQILPTK